MRVRDQAVMVEINTKCTQYLKNNCINQMSTWTMVQENSEDQRQTTNKSMTTGRANIEKMYKTQIMNVTINTRKTIFRIKFIPKSRIVMS